MAAPLDPPEGFDLFQEGGTLLLVAAGTLPILKEAGLHRPERWGCGEAVKGNDEAGRGSVRRLTLRAGDRLVLKKLKRGGWAGRFHRDRFRGTDRLLANLTVPAALRARNVPTPEPVGLLLQEGPSGFYQGWLAVREVAEAVDLGAWLEEEPEGDPIRLDPVIRFVRTLHQAGLRHRDLNLGNLLVRRAPEGSIGELFVIDLDGATLQDRPLPFRLQIASLWRLERSFVKRFGAPGPLGDGYRSRWTGIYTGGDERAARRMLRWWVLGDLLLRLHRAGWR